jgi:hypothetical protein
MVAAIQKVLRDNGVTNEAIINGVALDAAHAGAEALREYQSAEDQEKGNS